MAAPELVARLSDLLTDPQERLETEIKSWLDLTDSGHRAVIAKAIIALANHGGGHVIIGLEEAADGTFDPGRGRPADLSGYSQDTINEIVLRFTDPPFHCAVSFVPHPETGSVHPIITVPGAHRTPIRTKRASPDQKELINNAYYIRRPGPRSEPPADAGEWDRLLERCMRHRREEMVEAFRAIMEGRSPVTEPTSPAAPTTGERLDAWIARSAARWQQRTNELPKEAPGRLPRGHYRVAYQIDGELKRITQAQLLEVAREAVVRLTGWPPFWVPTRPEIAPYPYDGGAECWLAPPRRDQDAAHSDFWRLSPDGAAFLMRGFQEDNSEGNRAPQPGTVFDLTLPTWRLGECLLHAQRFAGLMAEPGARILFEVEYAGLAGRQLVAWANPNRLLFDGHRTREERYLKRVTLDAASIGENLVPIVDDIVRPLFYLFDFFELPAGLVARELGQMRNREP
jgi:hypothetical protein